VASEVGEQAKLEKVLTEIAADHPIDNFVLAVESNT
jgi:hypothetical protein